MGTLGTAVVRPSIAAGKFGVLFGAEDTTAGTAFTTSDQSGYAHVGYARVDVVNGTTIGGTAYGTANKNNFALVAPTGRILNLFPNDELTAISIRRGRTRPDQYDDVGECTITVNNATGSSDPDNNTGRYQRLTAPSVSAGVATAVYSSWLQPGMYSQVCWSNSAGSAVPLFTGILEQVEPTDDRYSTATYTFVDRIALLGRATMVQGNKVGGRGDSGAQRLAQICKSARLYDIYNGNGGTNLVEQIIDIQGFTKPLQLGSVGDTALDCIKTILNGQAGRVFASRSGVISMWDRSKMQSVATTMAGTFTDSPGVVAGYGYDEIQSNQAQNFLYNSALVTIGSSLSATYANTDSIAQYGERRYEVDTALTFRADGKIVSDDALSAAAFYATNWSTPSKSVASISLQAYGFSDADFEILCKLELQQGVRVYRRLPGNRVLDVNCVIEGIQIDLTPSTRRFTFYLSPRDTATLS